MINIIANRYADALFQIGTEGNNTAKFYNELVEISDAMESSIDLSSALTSPLVSKQEKKNIIEAIFTNSISNETKSLLKVLVDKNRCETISLIKDAYKSLMDVANNTIDGIVVTAVPMEQSKIKELEEKLSKKYNKNVTLKNDVDESILGGVLVRLGNEVIDGTVSSRLSKMKEELFKVIS